MVIGNYIRKVTGEGLGIRWVRIPGLRLPNIRFWSLIISTMKGGGDKYDWMEVIEMKPLLKIYALLRK